jgi:uncharacterized protein YutE (UPF0331/DUF86 family)
VVDPDRIRRKLADLELLIEHVGEFRDIAVDDDLPTTDAETFDVLADAGLLAERLHTAMRRMVGLRNIVVHQYASIDAEQVVRILRDHIGDLSGFARTAEGWL